MTVRELNRDQINQLKQDMIFSRCVNCDKFPSWEELADAAETISDEEILELFDGICFVPEDFWN